MSAIDPHESPSDSGRRWDQPGVPHRGYALDYAEELDNAEFVCEACGQEEIRFVHHLIHSETGLQLAVGCRCSEQLTEDYVTPRRQEREVRNRAKRRAKWLTRQWRVSQAGNHFLNIAGRNIVVFPSGAQWKFRIMGQLSPQAYPTRDAAKLGAFERLNSPRKHHADAAQLSLDTTAAVVLE